MISFIFIFLHLTLAKLFTVGMQTTLLFSLLHQYPQYIRWCCYWTM